MLCEEQFINKLLETKDYSLVENNNITSNYFTTCRNVFEFIKEFHNKYNDIPDKTTIAGKFGEFEFFSVQQDSQSIVDDLREQSLFRSACYVINKSTELFEKDANEGAKFLLANIDKLKPKYSMHFVDIAHDVDTRYNEYLERQNNFSKYFMPSGFDELDAHGFIGYERRDDLVLFTARTGQGKSFVLTKSASSVFEQGFNVALISPEMTVNQFAERVDSTMGGFSLNNLMYCGKVNGYKDFLAKLKQSKNRFCISTLEDFDNECTISKIRTFCKATTADILFIDGFDYLIDERAKKSDSVPNQLGHIAQDLLSLSRELSIPVVVVIQTNRKAVENDKDYIGTENITGSDKIGASCTRLISIVNKNPILEMTITKNRYGKSGKETKCIYNWNPDINTYTYIQNIEDINNDEETKQETEENKENFKSIF